MAAEEVTGGATSWKVLFPSSLPFLNCLNDLLLSESVQTMLNTLPDLCFRKLSIKKKKKNIIKLEMVAAVKS